MKIMRKIFKKLKNNDKLNTSYPVNKEDWLEFKTNEKLQFDNKDICFYIHIPFCLSKCKFCEYVKYEKTDNASEKRYIEILKRDIQNFIDKHKDKNLTGLDIGGGTPTCLDEDNFKNLLEFVKENIFDKMKLSKDTEPSIESTFLSITEEKIRIISLNGFKRISFGLQTVNKKFLKENDRSHPTVERMKNALSWCEKYGINKVNIDLMYGLKNQTKKDLKDALATIEYFKPQQVTLYEFRTNILKIKENMSKKALFKQYCYLFHKLTRLGYNGIFGQNTFSLDKYDLGLSSYIRHRMLDNTSYKGFGISAQSKGSNGVSYNIGKTEQSLEQILAHGTFDEEDIYVLPKEEMAAKYVAISGYSGRFSLKILDEILKETAREYYKNQLEFLLKKRYVTISANNIVQITKRGFVHYGAILSLFYPSYNKQ